jgi:hypothetical protein
MASEQRRERQVETASVPPFLDRSGSGSYPEGSITKGALMPRIRLSSLALLIGLTIALPAAWAAVDREEAVSQARRAAPGRVLAVERGVHVDNSLVWRIKVLTAAGEIRLVVIDAETGRFR